MKAVKREIHFFSTLNLIKQNGLVFLRIRFQTLQIRNRMNISIKIFLLLIFFFCSSFSLSHSVEPAHSAENTTVSKKEKRKYKKLIKLKKRVAKWQAKRANVSGFRKFLFLFLIPFVLIGGLLKLLISELTIAELLLATLGAYAIVVLFAIAILLVALGEGPRG